MCGVLIFAERTLRGFLALSMRVGVGARGSDHGCDRF